MLSDLADKQTFAETFLILAIADLRVEVLLHISGNNEENFNAM